MNKQPKYRPVLTEAQILHAINLAKKEQPISDASIDLITALAPYLYKIQNGVVEPSNVPTNRPKVNSLESLGAPVDTYDIESMAKEERWILAYAKYEDDPTLCSVREIQDAREHMYLNDLMSQLELEQFEREIAIDVKGN